MYIYIYIYICIYKQTYIHTHTYVLNYYMSVCEREFVSIRACEHVPVFLYSTKIPINKIKLKTSIIMRPALCPWISMSKKTTTIFGGEIFLRKKLKNLAPCRKRQLPLLGEEIEQLKTNSKNVEKATFTICALHIKRGTKKPKIQYIITYIHT
jgi:hypothetical protein